MIAANTESDVVEAVRAAHAHHRSLEVVGAGTKRAFGRAAPCDDILDVSALNGVVKYEPSELILTVLPGTPVAEITSLLAQKNQRLGFEPADWGPLFGAPAGKATIGGVLSADANGCASLRYGRARDSLLGFRAVNGFGEAYKGGGKVVKNVTGFDLPKLMCGAMGTLGVFTEVTLRVYPKPPRQAALVVRDISPEDGFSLLRRIGQSPLEATALCYLPASAPLRALGYIGEGAALIRLEGADEPLKEKIAALRALAPRAQEIDAPEIFASIANGEVFLTQTCDVWRVFVPPSEADWMLGAIGPEFWQADAAGGLLWIGLREGYDSNMRDLCREPGGHAVLLRAGEDTRNRIPVFARESKTRMALTKSVKAAFDPQGIFNPGRMWKGV
ncbi:MAG TPA: FAD-binding protein [Rhizomicrobium sp.]